MTASLVVPFLSAFPSLKKAILGWYDDYGDFVNADDDSEMSEEVEEALSAIQRALCGAYRSKLIPSDAVISGADITCANVRSIDSPRRTWLLLGVRRLHRMLSYEGCRLSQSTAAVFQLEKELILSWRVPVARNI